MKREKNVLRRERESVYYEERERGIEREREKV